MRGEPPKTLGFGRLTKNQETDMHRGPAGGLAPEKWACGCKLKRMVTLFWGLIVGILFAVAAVIAFGEDY
jgi:hypothetical protein